MVPSPPSPSLSFCWRSSCVACCLRHGGSCLFSGVCSGHRVCGARLWMAACPLAWRGCLSAGGFVHRHLHGRNAELCVRGRSLAIPDDLFALATAADYVVFTGWFLLSLVIGRDRHASARPQPLVMHRQQIHRLLMPHRLQGLPISPGHGHRVCSGVWP